MSVHDGNPEAGAQIRLQRDLSKIKPDIIGISSYLFSLFETWQLLQFVQKELPYAHVMLGGPHVNASPEASLGLSGVSSVCIGEGETAFSEAAKALDSGRDLKGIRGIMYKKNGEIFRNELRSYTADPNVFPFPDRNLVPQEAFASLDFKHNSGRLTSMIAGRGCPFSCAYCCGNHRRQYGLRSVENLFGEMELLYDQGYRRIKFWDDTFNVKRDFVAEFCERLIDSRLHFAFAIRARVDCMDDELAALLARAGCHSIVFGVETPDPDSLEKINKKVTQEDILCALRATRSHGIVTTANYIIGFPHETAEQVENTLRFSRGVGTTFAAFFIAMPLEGTQLYKDALASGDFEYDYLDAYSKKPDHPLQLRLWTPGFTEGEILGCLKKAYFKYYLRWSFMTNPAVIRVVWLNFTRIFGAILSMIFFRIMPAQDREES